MAKKLTIEEALDYCLQNVDRLSREDLLAAFPQYREQIEPLLTLALSVGAADIPLVPTARRAAMKQRILDKAASMPAAPPRHVTPVRPTAPRLLPWAIPSRLARPLWAVAGVAAALLLFVWWSASSALADSPFYDVKLTTENVLVNFSPSAADRVRGRASLAHERMKDLRAMAANGTISSVGKALDNFDYQLNTAADELDSVPTQQRPDAAKTVYVSSAEGDQVVSSLKTSPYVPASVRDDLDRALADAQAASTIAARVLSDAGIDPASVPVPVVQAVIVATPSVPVNQPAAVRPSTTSTVTPGSVAGYVTPAAGVPTEAPTPTPTSTQQAVQPLPTFALIPTPPEPQLSPTATTGPRKVSPTRTFTPRPVRPTATPTRAVVSIATSTLPPATSTATTTHTPTPVPATATVAIIAPTYTPVPTGTPVPPPARCGLAISRVSASCRSASSVGWSAQVANNSAHAIDGSWTLELQVNEAGGGFRTIASQSGNATFGVGTTTVAGSIIGDISGDGLTARVVFRVTSDSPSCDIAASSSTFNACGAGDATPTDTPTAVTQPTYTPTPQVTNTPTPVPQVTNTPTARPTDTPVPQPTDTPTVEPTRTARPHPTRTPPGQLTPRPTRTPR